MDVVQKDGDGLEREFGSTLRRGQKLEVAENLSRVPKQTNEQPVPVVALRARQDASMVSVENPNQLAT